MPSCKEAADDQVNAMLPPIIIVFGRFNPPTVGHEKLLRAAQRAATGGDLRIYPSRTQDTKKNPLDPATKIAYMRKMFPDLGRCIIDSPETRTILDALAAASGDGYSKAIIVVGSDRQEEFHGLTQKYNGDLYTFDSIQVISAGIRDADSEGTEGMSASKMRQAVARDDFPLFRTGIPSTLGEEDTKALFDAVRKGIGSKE